VQQNHIIGLHPINSADLSCGHLCLSARYSLRHIACLLLALAITLSVFAPNPVVAQNPQPIESAEARSAGETPDAVPEKSVGEPEAAGVANVFRLERVPVAGGAELVTVFAKLGSLETSEDNKWVPLVTVLRYTLGDASLEKDRLRYVWPLTYTRPSLKQRFLGAIPFLYTRMGNKGTISEKSPPPAMDLAAPESDVWNNIFWTALQNILLDPYGMPIKASTRSYRRNISDYRKTHTIRALSVLSLYQTLNGGEGAFSTSEMAEIHSRLSLSDKTFGGLVDDLNLQRYYEKSTSQQKDDRGHNWELLRQRAEAESLYFEPLQMPDGSTTHALLWIARRDLEKPLNHRFSGRFLNISDPRSDKRLLNWKGYVETRYFDKDSRPVTAATPDAELVEMIPIALYGLDTPKIPMLLIDFRDNLNPKKREMSRRVLQDITRNILSVSRFGNLPYLLGRTVFDFVTWMRGFDVNQPSRLQSYSQLKLLLALNDSLEPELRSEITRRLEKVSLNPLENDLDVEARVARQQYEALLAYARRADGLAAKLERDRRAEMVPLAHGRFELMFFRVANILSFGKYVHREDAAPDTEARLDVSRRLAYHTNFLRQVAKSNFQIDVAWNLDEVRRSLSYIGDHGSVAGSEAIVAAGRIFSRTHDQETRRACLESLSRIATPKARNELLRISQNKELDPSWRDTINTYISQINPPQPPGTAVTAKQGTGQFAQQ
jgi:hypothetical protein